MSLHGFQSISLLRTYNRDSGAETGLPMPSGDKPNLPTRRQFVAAGALGGAVAVIGCKSQPHSGREFLSVDQAATLGALCDQIIPADDYPSASQAGVLDYIDRQLVRAYRRHRDAYREGLESARQFARKRFNADPETLPAERQLQWATAVERGQHAFFEMVREHTFEGYYGSPRHGGNRDAVSWKMLGLSEPPNLGRSQYDLNQNPNQDQSKGGRS
jgi:gluconate 2-dehydrogenase gamma chain